jgi:hypothetical protein
LVNIRNKVVSLFHLISFISLHGHGISARLSRDTLRGGGKKKEKALYYFKPNLKFLERELISNYKLGEMKGIEVWRKSSESAVTRSEVKCIDVR